MSIEPVVGDESDPYAIREEDIPQIKEEYDKLAKIMIEREKEGKGFNFFHFMIDLEGGPCVMKRMSGCGSRNRISVCHTMGRSVSMPSVCRTGRIPDGKCRRWNCKAGDCR